MVGNGTQARERAKDLHLLKGADAIDKLDDAANALLEVASVFKTIHVTIGNVGADTAKALSEMTEMRRHLADITAREQSLIATHTKRANLMSEALTDLRVKHDVLQAKYDALQMAQPKRVKRKIKAKRAKRR